MREHFIKKLMELAGRDSQVILLVGDVGYNFVERFRDAFPNQFINLGVCEQSGIGIACGMAREGWKPYYYTMKNFIILRAAEQVRNDVCYSNNNVTLCGVGGSSAYAFLGAGHNLYGSEEKDFLKNLPNLNNYFPQSEAEVYDCMEFEHNRVSPAYIAL